MKQHLKQYLDFVYSAQNQLVNDRIGLKSTANKRYCDIPPGMDVKQLITFQKEILEMEYNGLHAGLTFLWQHPNKTYISTLKKIGLGATHGTSIKWQIKTGASYSVAVKNDKNILDIIDPSEQVPINYDLFAGNLGQSLVDDFTEALSQNAQLLMKKLGLKKKDQSDAMKIMEYIVETVKKEYYGSKRPIMFEIPGTQGWSMFPSPSQFSELTAMVQSIFPQALFCIDVGHLLTWKQSGVSLKSLLDSIYLLKKTIGMIHISSAGSINPDFKFAYQQEHLGNNPDWHLNGLDLMLAVHEKDMIDIIKEIRLQTRGNNVIEVCETRKPSTAVADYFQTVPLHEINDGPYLMSLKLQAKLLGYSI